MEVVWILAFGAASALIGFLPGAAYGLKSDLLREAVSEWKRSG